jgi:hypothetical protein
MSPIAEKNMQVHNFTNNDRERQRSPEEWSENFTYAYFRKICQVTKSNFEIYRVFEAALALNSSKTPKLILRHDVDVSLERALPMAAIEHDYKIASTYLVNPNCQFYDLQDPVSRRILQELLSMGHEVGLHFDHPCREQGKFLSYEREIHLAKGKLAAIIGRPVLSFSTHRPQYQPLYSQLMVQGMVNSYAPKLMQWYLSDSLGRWREGEPLPKLRQPANPLLQLLIHPIWWGEVHLSAVDRKNELVEYCIRGRDPRYQEAFHRALTLDLGL